MIGRRRVRRTRRGDYEIRLPPNERAVIRSLLPQLRELVVGGDDPSARRLFPSAYAHDEDLEREYQRLVRHDLVQRRIDAIETLDATLDELRLDEDQLLAWMTAINDLRLVLGTRLDVTEETDVAVDPDDPEAPLLAAYFYLGWLLEQVVSALDA